MSATHLPQRDTLSAQPFQVESLTQLDALVGRHVMGCSPRVYWEDSYTQWRFDTLPEALEAMRDPFFSALTPEGSRPRSSLREVQEFPPYSSHLGTAWAWWSISARSRRRCCSGARSAIGRPLSRRSGCEAATAPLAICLAALRSRGVQVDFEE